MAIHRRVIIIDDEEDQRDMIREFMTMLGEESHWHFTVIDAENGKKGLELMRRHRPHLVFLDYNMPILDGIHVLQSIKEFYTREIGHIPIIMTTAKNDVETVQKAIALGARDYLVKPYDLTVFLQKVRKVLRMK